MRDEMSKNDYLDMLDSVEMTPEMESALDDALTVIDSHMMKMRPSERAVLGMKLSTSIGATTLANTLKDHRYLLASAIEAAAEDITTMAEATFTAFDDGTFTTH